MSQKTCLGTEFAFLRGERVNVSSQKYRHGLFIRRPWVLSDKFFSRPYPCVLLIRFRRAGEVRLRADCI